MIKSQLDNLINYYILYCSFTDYDVLNTSPDYLLEKWEKYIGIKDIQNPNKVLDIESKYYHTFKEYQNKWGEESLWVKDILEFTMVLNTKPYNLCCPSELVKTFNDMIGDVNKINNYTYNGLHDILKRKALEWVDHNIRDYNLVILTNG